MMCTLLSNDKRARDRYISLNDSLFTAAGTSHYLLDYRESVEKDRSSNRNTMEKIVFEFIKTLSSCFASVRPLSVGAIMHFFLSRNLDSEKNHALFFFSPPTIFSLGAFYITGSGGSYYSLYSSENR